MPVKAAGGSLISDAKLKQLYASMLRSRLAAEHARRLRKRRATAFYRASMGQEAITAGCAIDLRPEDTVVDTVSPEPSPVCVVKGAPVRDFVCQLEARRGATSAPRQPLKSATRAAMANKEQNTHVVVVFASARATGMAGLRPALKLAAARSLPIIFVVENNPWKGKGSEIRKLKTQQKGLTSITVDGNDVVAVYRVAYESLERVRKGGGPVLIEGKTYRQDGQGPIRSERDPLAHMEQYLAAKGLFTLGWKNQLMQKFTRELAAAIETVS
jgi:TPP-dependent pyruvate/acetoin dehydrogenase alpha subunit